MKSYKLLLSLMILMSVITISGCGLLIDAALSGDKVQSMGDNTYRVTYDGYGANEHWYNSCRKACGGGSFEIISQNQIVRPYGLPGWTGVVKCKDQGGGRTQDTASFTPEIDTEQTVRASIDKGGAPFMTWSLNDNIPISKVLFYKRGDLRHPILFTFDDQKKEFVFQSMWTSKADKFEEMKDKKEYKQTIDEWYSIELANRSSKYEKIGKIDLQYKYINMIENIHPIGAGAYNAVAWFYATVPDLKYRDGKKAVKYGEKSISMVKHWMNMDTLAAAHAQAGDFEKAVYFQNEAINMCQEAEGKAKLREHLELYKNHKTYVEVNE